MSKKIKFVRIFTPPGEWGCYIDGGGYASSVKYSRNSPDEPFTVTYWNSGSDGFDFCDVYGSFRSCRTCDEYDSEENRCCAEPILVPESQVLKVLEEPGERDEVTVEYF